MSEDRACSSAVFVQNYSTLLVQRDPSRLFNSHAHTQTPTHAYRQIHKAACIVTAGHPPLAPQYLPVRHAVRSAIGLNLFLQIIIIHVREWETTVCGGLPMSKQLFCCLVNYRNVCERVSDALEKIVVFNGKSSTVKSGGRVGVLFMLFCNTEIFTFYPKK